MFSYTSEKNGRSSQTQSSRLNRDVETKSIFFFFQVRFIVTIRPDFDGKSSFLLLSDEYNIRANVSEVAIS